MLIGLPIRRRVIILQIYLGLLAHHSKCPRLYLLIFDVSFNISKSIIKAIGHHMNSKAFLNDALKFVCQEISHLINIEGKEKLGLNQKQCNKCNNMQIPSFC